MTADVCPTSTCLARKVWSTTVIFSMKCLPVVCRLNDVIVECAFLLSPIRSWGGFGWVGIVWQVLQGSKKLSQPWILHRGRKQNVTLWCEGCSSDRTLDYPMLERASILLSSVPWPIGSDLRNGSVPVTRLRGWGVGECPLLGSLLLPIVPRSRCQRAMLLESFYPILL